MLVGITSSLETVLDSRGVENPRLSVPRAYSDAVSMAGGIPVLLPIGDLQQLPGLLDRIDAVVISGGGFDIPPALYGEPPHPKLGPLCEERSLFERALVLAAIERDLPLLGICGGMQVLNVSLGGSLVQDLSEKPGAAEHQQPHDKRRPQHEVTIAADSLLARTCGATRIQVNSTHHQAVKDLGRGLTASATSPDGVIEAVELANRRFVLGVQWHPESLTDRQEHRAIYAALIEAAMQGQRRPVIVQP